MDTNQVIFFGALLVLTSIVASAFSSRFGAPILLGQYLARRFGGRQVIGDRIKLGGVELVVREIVDGAITRVGLKLHD